MTEVAEDLHQRLAEAGFRSAIVSTRRLPDLRADLERLLSDGILDGCFYNELRRRHDLDFQFEVPADFPAARSIISIAAPQPKVSVGFRLSGRTYHLLIPPTYTYDTDKTASRIISECLLEYGYGAKSARLPQKPLVVHCGLAAYGRNNITYIDGLGSFHRPGAFFSDLPPGPDCWQDLRMMDRCEDCFACGKRCPTGAITGERFLIDASRCLTYFNEEDEAFPEWIDPAWHNCLMGCLICQDTCPANKDHGGWIVAGAEFSEDETRMILELDSLESLPSETIAKLKAITMFYDGPLQRNLRVLLDKGSE